MRFAVRLWQASRHIETIHKTRSNNNNMRKEKETKTQSRDQQCILSVLTLLINSLFLAFTFFIFFFQHLLSEALSEVAAKASTNCGPAFVMSFPCYAKGVERRATAISSSKVASGKWKQMKGKRSIKM